MPTYEYKCEECGYVYDVFHKISEEPRRECPKCLKQTLKRSIGGGNAVLNFKGTGFYITDYANKNAESKETPNKEKS